MALKMKFYYNYGPFKKYFTKYKKPKYLSKNGLYLVNEPGFT